MITENLTPFEINVIQVALDHLREMCSGLLGENKAQNLFHKQIIETCNSLLTQLK